MKTKKVMQPLFSCAFLSCARVIVIQLAPRREYFCVFFFKCLTKMKILSVILTQYKPNSQMVDTQKKAWYLTPKRGVLG